MEIKQLIPNPRLELANKIMNLGEEILPLDTPYVDEFIFHFMSAKYPKIDKMNLNKESLIEQMRDQDIEGITIENLLLDGHDVMGSVRIQKKNSNKQLVICGFQELKEWASDRPFVKWLGWIIALVGAIFTLLIFISK